MYRPRRDWGEIIQFLKKYTNKWVWLMSSITIIKRATRLVATIIKFNNILRHSIYVGQGQLERVKEGILHSFSHAWSWNLAVFHL